VMQSFDLLEKVRKQRTKQIHFYVQTSSVAEGQIDSLKNIIGGYAGGCATFLHLRIPGKSEVTIKLPDQLSTVPSDRFFDDVQTLFPGCTIELR